METSSCGQGRARTQSPAQAKRRVYHIDGSGARPDGSGSGFAWVRPATGEKRIKLVDGLTSNQAEYRGFLAVLKHLPEGSRARIYTDSQLVCEQFNKRWAVKDSNLAELLSKARYTIEEKELDITVQWIPREQNLAGKLLERRR